jgi:hypothetical protein
MTQPSEAAPASHLGIAAWVTHERLDDEVIAIDLETGIYYGLDDVAAECWTLLAGTASTGDLVSALQARYDAPVHQLEADVAAFVAELLRERLIEPRAVDPDHHAPTLDRGSATTYTAPVLIRYDDLQDLLLLDPIHEVDEAGWPVARAD